ncbi:MAG: hypothetical protein VXW18_06135, partial [Pseudomonadota bacterium]|nr:hypothetical protein [Pseudomonadota bacterium]
PARRAARADPLPTRERSVASIEVISDIGVILVFLFVLKKHAPLPPGVQATQWTFFKLNWGKYQEKSMLWVCCCFY